MKTEKSFDCVKMMRDIRNKIHEEWENKSFFEIQEILDKAHPEYKTNKSKKQKTSV